MTRRRGHNSGIGVLLRRAAILAATAVASLAALAGAAAAAEPNDDIAMAQGPLLIGTSYDGSIDTPNDVDFYFFYVNGAKSVDVAVAKVGAGCDTWIDADLNDSDGNQIAHVYVGSDGVAHLQATTAAAGAYYVRVYPDTACAGNPYRLTVGPADAISASPTGLPRPTTSAAPLYAEPNDDRTQAAGPLTPVTWTSAAIDTPNDVDWFFFHVNGAKGIDVDVAKIGAGCDQWLDADLDDADGNQLAHVYVGSDRIAHLQARTAGAGIYYIKVYPEGACGGDPYQLFAGPSDAVTATPGTPSNGGNPGGDDLAGGGGGQPAPTCVVPRTRGLTLNRAKARLRRAGCSFATRHGRAFSTRVRARRVVGTRPPAGATTSRRIRIIVSRGLPGRGR